VLNDEVVDSGLQYQVESALEDDADYTIKVRLGSAEGLWSAYDEIAISTNFTNPPQPTALISAQTGYVSIKIDNPAPGVGVPAIAENEIEYKDDGDSGWSKLKTGLGEDATWKDCMIRSEKRRKYRIIAIGENGAKSTSIEYEAEITIDGVALHDFDDDDPASTLLIFEPFNAAMGDQHEWDMSPMRMAGRKKRVWDVGEHADVSFRVVFEAPEDRGVWALLIELLNRTTRLACRTHRGDIFVGVVPRAGRDIDVNFRSDTISLELHDADED
jgi:hypothetical protein